MGEIATFYTQLRTAEDADALPITVRTLETIIRLSTAVAKSRLAKGRGFPVTLAGHLCLGRAGPKLQRLGISLAGMHEPELQLAASSWPPWARQLSGVQCCVSTDMTRCTVRVWSLRSTSRLSSALGLAQEWSSGTWQLQWTSSSA